MVEEVEMGSEFMKEGFESRFFICFDAPDMEAELILQSRDAGAGEGPAEGFMPVVLE